MVAAQARGRGSREAGSADAPSRDEAPKAGAQDIAVQPAPETPEPEFDPATLPPLESISSVSDITAFLRAGVPADLTRAALRRVWTADPAIRDFVGLAENAWDFTDPNAMPGFGPLEMTDEVRRMIAEVVDRSARLRGRKLPRCASREWAILKTRMLPMS